MDYNIGSAHAIRCDWLDVTFPVDSPLSEIVTGFLLDLGSPSRRINDDRVEFRLPQAEWGNIQLEHSRRGWARLSASGGSCEALRAVSGFGAYLGLISDHPHTVTRLDACLDVLLPGPPIISALVDRYPPGSDVHLTRKGVPTRYNLQPVLGGGLTGTFYAGDIRGSARVLGRVYDKQAERRDKGVEIGPRTRYEIIARKGTGISLRDAYEPAAMFWHFAAPALCNAPANTPAWVPFEGDTWSPQPFPKLTPYERLKRRVDASVDVSELLKIADEIPVHGRRQLLRMLGTRLGLRDVVFS